MANSLNSLIIAIMIDFVDYLKITDYTCLSLSKVMNYFH
jgi:hypothetical protein